LERILKDGASNNSEEAVKITIECWKKAIHKQTKDTTQLIKLIEENITKLKEQLPSSHLLVLLEFLIEPKDIANYSANALEVLKSLPEEIKNKKYMIPILAYIISTGNVNTEEIAKQLTPIFLHLVKNVDIKTMIKVLGLLLTMIRMKMLSNEQKMNVLTECKLLLKHYKRSIRTFARACVNEILSNP